MLHQAVGALLVAATVAWGAHCPREPASERMTVVTVYAIFADADEAERIGRQMVEERLAACVNILGAVPLDLPLAGRDREARRSRRARSRPPRDQADALIARIAELHSYDVPCIIVWPIDKLLADYADWVEDNVRRYAG